MVRLKIMTYNICHGRGLDGTVDIGRTCDVIRAQNPDIVGLQEVDRHFGPRSFWMDELGYLAAELEMNWTFGATISRRISPFSRRRGYYGNAILSRFPILDSHSEVLPAVKTLEPRGFTHARLDVGQNVVLNVIVTHMGLSAEERAIHREKIMEYLSSVPDPKLLLGDFNENPDGPTVMYFSSLLTDAASLAGVSGPRIDYVFLGKGASLDEFAAIRSDASDHDPVVAVVTLRGPEQLV